MFSPMDTAGQDSNRNASNWVQHSDPSKPKELWLNPSESRIVNLNQPEVKKESQHHGPLSPSLEDRSLSPEAEEVGARLRDHSLDDTQNKPPLSPKQSASFSANDRGIIKSIKRAREEEQAESLSESDPHRPAKRYSPTPPPTQNDVNLTYTSRRPSTGIPYHSGRDPTSAPSLSLSQSKSSLRTSSSTVIPEFSLFRQPETKPITEDQLVNEVKGIYGGLVMVEKKCIEIVQQQSQSSTKLSKEQWQALIALHRTLLHEHHDFFSASQHPTASQALRRLANKYAMPARMWRHGIHAFLELLRHRLPDSLDHMLSFVYLAYSMMALLMESIPSFVETWIECLGDLARYRMAIEEIDLRDREIWSNVARMWYNKAADLSPNIGRIQHHLAVLARPNIVQQLFFYSKALVSVIPFPNARESIMLLFTPLLEHNAMIHPRYPAMESSLVTAAGILFTRGSVAEFRMYIDQFFTHLDPHLARTSSKFKVQGPELASSLFAMTMDFGSKDNNSLWTMFTSHLEDLINVECEKKNLDRKDLPTNYIVTDPVAKDEARDTYWKTVSEDSNMDRLTFVDLPVDGKLGPPDEIAGHSGLVLYETIVAVTSRIGDKNIVPFMHLVLATLWSMAYVPKALPYVETCIPWGEVAEFLNTLGRSSVNYNNIESPAFPSSYGGTGRQLPEDFNMRGLMTMQYYYPSDWFTVQVVDEDERLLELPSHQAPRAERCLWCGVRLASLGRYLTYDLNTKRFEATPFALSLSEFKLQRDAVLRRVSDASYSLPTEDFGSKMDIETGL